MSLLSEADAKRIEQTIAQIETTTAGEILVVVTPQSDGYELWRGVPALGLSSLSAALLAEFGPALPVSWLFALQLPLLFLFWWCMGWSAVLRRLAPVGAQAAAVDARAKQLFLERGLADTRDRSGVLLLLSELEHRVEVLADKGIHERVGVEGWERHVQSVTQAIRAGKAAEGITTALLAVGAELAAAFPPRADDSNELANQVVRVP